MAKYDSFLPDDFELFERVPDAPKLRWRHRLSCALAVLRGQGVVCGAKLAVKGNLLWLATDKKGPTVVRGVSVYNEDIYQDRLYVTSPRLIEVSRPKD